MLQIFLRGATDGWELATDQRPRPLRRGRPARRRGRRRLRRRGAAARRGHRRGARRPRARRCRPDGWSGKELAALADGHAQPAGPRGRRGARAGAVRRRRCARPSTTSPRLDEPVAVQRVHGDFHLGQVMRTLDGWMLLDFEGEPARPLAERRGARLAAEGRRRACCAPSTTPPGTCSPTTRPTRSASTAPPSGQTRNRDAFCTGYAEAGGADPRSQTVLLRAFETDKAVYEVVYEARNRPTWLPIPMAAIRTARRLDGASRERLTHERPPTSRAATPTPQPPRREQRSSTGRAAHVPRPAGAGRGPAPAGRPASHHDPHSVLGPHPHDGGVTVRTLRPWATAVDGAGRRRPLRDAARERRRLGRRRCPARRCPTTGSRSPTTARRALSTTPTASCRRSARSTCT